MNPALFIAAVLAAAAAWSGAPAPPRSSAWLSRLPAGEAKRKFILDCAGCHQFDEKIARPRTGGRCSRWATRFRRAVPNARRRDLAVIPSAARGLGRLSSKHAG